MPSDSVTPLVDVSGGNALAFIAVMAFAIALLWFIPVMYDLRWANRWRREQQKDLLDQLIAATTGRKLSSNGNTNSTNNGSGSSSSPSQATGKGLSVEEVRQLVSAIDSPPRGAQGLTQSLLGLIVATFVGVAMIATLVSTALDSSDLRKTIVTALVSILATIAGFYFGARTAQISSEQATRPPEPRRSHEPEGPELPRPGAEPPAAERGAEPGGSQGEALASAQADLPAQAVEVDSRHTADEVGSENDQEMSTPVVAKDDMAAPDVLTDQEDEPQVPPDEDEQRGK
jgi:hypothetical protein